MDGLTIRRFEPDDAGRVRELHEVALRNAGDFVEGVPEPDLADVTGAYLDTGGEFLVGELDQVVAMGAYRPIEGYVADALDDLDERAAEIKRMRVHPDHQRRGFGRTLYAELERRARAAGYRELVLDTGIGNDGARAFYEAMGFDLARRLSIHAAGETVELVLYRRGLDG